MKKALTICLTLLVLAACAKQESAESRTEPPPKNPEVTEPDGESTTRASTTDAPLSKEEAFKEISTRVADYNATYLDGSGFELADYRGKVVLLNVWATWCGPCRYEIPELKRLHDEYAANGLEIVGVSIDVKQAEPAVREFVASQEIKYPVVLDPEGRLPMLLRTTSIPTTILVDRDGNVAWYHIGIVSEKDPKFREALDAALGV